MSQSNKKKGKKRLSIYLFICVVVVLPVDVPLRTCLWSHDIFRPLFVILAASEFTQRWPFHACYMAESLRENSRKWQTWGGDVEIDCVPFASLVIHSQIICRRGDFFFIQSHQQILILIDMQWTIIIMTAFILNDMLQFCHWASLWGHCWSFFFFPVALVVINLLVRQFRAEEGFSLGVHVWAGKANPLFARWKRLFSLARWWMWCLSGCVAQKTPPPPPALIILH